MSQKEDGMAVHPLIACLRPDNSGDKMCVRDQQFLDPDEILSFVGHRSDPSKIRERPRRSFSKHDNGMTGTV